MSPLHEFNAMNRIRLQVLKIRLDAAMAATAAKAALKGHTFNYDIYGTFTGERIDLVLNQLRVYHLTHSNGDYLDVARDQ